MIRGFLKRALQRAVVLTAAASMLLVLVPVEVEAAKPPPAPLSCSISPADGTTAVGVSIMFTGMTSGGKGSKSYSWDFSDGSGSPAAATGNTANVIYSTAGGPFAVLLDVTDGQGAAASCGTTVTVTQVGVNTPPVANDDGYPAVINTTLNIAAPGVLGNDDDADGDPLTAVLETDVISGSLILNADGSFDYTPNTDFLGQDTFTYFADDGTDQSDTPATVTITVEDAAPPTGAELYTDNCRMCHGIEAVGGFAQRDIRTAGANRISGAITRRADMNFLGTRSNPLTTAEIESIAAYMDTLPKGQDDIPRRGDLVVGEDQFRKSCSYCHSFGGTPIEPPRPGPDLFGIGTNYSDAFLGAWVGFPIEMIEAGAYPNPLEPYRMPDLGHSDINAWDIAQFMLEQDSIGPLVDSAPVELTPEQFEDSRQDYFNLCAGCHGLFRTGATGPDIGALRSSAIGTDGLGAILRYGTPAGMGNFGQTGIMTDEQITNMAAYLQLPPPDAPLLPMADIQASWDLVIPVANRPTAPEHTRNWQNYTGVILRDAGQVAIIDGDTNEEVVRLSTGFAVHILRSSSTGRYFYAIGRDGLVTLIDLWTNVPTIVANVKGCHDARSVDASKFPGFEDTYVIEGCYWPPQYVVYDGLTLEPTHREDLPLVDMNGAPLIENRVASIVASHSRPEWVVSQKEAGFVSIVPYAPDVNNPGITPFQISKNIPTAKFLHDGGFDHTGDYFLVAANASNLMVVVNLNTQMLEALIPTGQVPHPGRGVNWEDPVYGWVNATSHIGEGKVTVYGADPVRRPDVAWQIVREITLPSSGSLFIKSHPISPWVLVDMTLSATGYDQDICAISKATGTLDRCFKVVDNGKAVHFEFNMDGTEVWVSDWDPNGAVIVLDSTTLAEIRRFTGLPTPTGKFNVYNTAHDIY
jgi:nitrite reductase (NO-forming)/hydroxylamine reductase